MSRTRFRREWTAVAMVVGAIASAVWAPVPAMAATPADRAGTAGTDVPMHTDSAVTVPGRGPFADLKVTVAQTKNLVHQSVSVTWSGGVPSNAPDAWSGKFRTHFLQIFQCWGDDDGTNPANPGPPPEQCEFGADPLTDATKRLPVNEGSNNYTRIIGDTTIDGASLDKSQGFFVPDPSDRTGAAGRLWKPFRSVDGQVVNAQTGYVSDNRGGHAEWQNPRFDFITSNEIRFARTYPTGTGSELFEAVTGEESQGLGCGQKVQVRAGTTAIPRCWLVVVPRGGAEENLPLLTDTAGRSPLTPSIWANRVAVPLEFNPLDSPCRIGADERRIVGSELAKAAVANWQPALCSAPGAPPYVYGAQGDGSSRRQLLSRGTGAAGMAVVSRPIDPKAIDSSKAVTYAPFTLSGVAIGLNIERRAKQLPSAADTKAIDEAQQPYAGSRVGRLNLTPRLVAKLLTESYGGQFYALTPEKAPPDHSWLKNNPGSPVDDPDFVQYNPEFQDLALSVVVTGGSLVVEAPTSDAATLVWQWVLADPEARAWLAGSPDAGGMVVNPRYNTDAAHNPSGSAFAQPEVPETYPVNDPYCFQAPKPEDLPRPPNPLCMLDVHPYAASMEAAAQKTRAANIGDKTSHDPYASDQNSPENYFGSTSGPQLQGNRSVLSITDTASAARFGLQTASLSRAGDDGANRNFVAADQAGLLAGVQAMVPSPAPGVLQPNPATKTAGAYPLTMLTYAAAVPAGLDAKARTEYAAVVDYAAGPGQKPGLAFGDLAPGYAPMPANLRAQATAAAKAIREGTPPGATPPPGEAAQPASPPQSGPVGDGTTFDGGGTSSPGEALAAPPAGIAAGPTPPADPGGPVALARALVRTAAVAVGFMRYTLPFVAGVGLLAALAAWLLTARRRRPGGARPADGSGVEVPTGGP